MGKKNPVDMDHDEFNAWFRDINDKVSELADGVIGNLRTGRGW